MIVEINQTINSTKENNISGDPKQFTFFHLAVSSHIAYLYQQMAFLGRLVHGNTVRNSILSVHAAMRSVGLMSSSALFNNGAVDILGMPTVLSRSFATGSRRFEKNVFLCSFFSICSQPH